MAWMFVLGKCSIRNSNRVCDGVACNKGRIEVCSYAVTHTVRKGGRKQLYYIIAEEFSGFDLS